MTIGPHQTTPQTRLAFEKKVYCYQDQINTINNKLYARRTYIDWLDLLSQDMQDSYHLADLFSDQDSPAPSTKSSPICMTCHDGKHENLMQCPFLQAYIPSAENAHKKLPRGVCRTCLMTDKIQTNEHTCMDEKIYICNNAHTYKLICECGYHESLHKHMHDSNHPVNGSLYLRTFLKEIFFSCSRSSGSSTIL